MSRRLLKEAEYSIRKLFASVTNLSYSARYDYKIDMRLAVGQLHEAGIPLSHIKHFKEKYIRLLVERWKNEGLSIGTIKNRLTKIRYVCNYFKKGMVVPTNTSLGLGSRTAHTTNKALRSIDIERFKHPSIQHSVKLQQLFGLRREESLKFILSQADKGTYIELKGSWTKGGIPRVIPINTQAQRDYLDSLSKVIAKGESLIPKDKSYREHLYTYVSQVELAGYKNLHGLRHAYAQDRYKALTAFYSHTEGWHCPFMGGPNKKEMTAEYREIDNKVRLIISEELGHSRKGITKTYIG